MDSELLKVMNDQIKNELYSAYSYLAMSAYCEAANMPGFAHWLRVQAEEEVGHAMKFFDHINERGDRVTLQAIEQPREEFNSFLEVFQQAFAQEQNVTGQINKLYDLAMQKKDYAAQALLQWFVVEQVEEEKMTSQLVAQLKMSGDHPAALVMLDRELGARTPEEEA
jgi:ferritin